MEEGVTTTDRWARRLGGPWVFWPMSLVGLGLLAAAWLGPAARVRLQLEADCAQMQVEVDQLLETQASLKATREALLSEPRYSERVVRQELRLVRPGEVRLAQPTALGMDVAPLGPRPAAARWTPDPVLAAVARFAEPRLQLRAFMAGVALGTLALVSSVAAWVRRQKAVAAPV